MSIHTYDLDSDGYADTVLSDSYPYDTGYYGDSYGDPYYGSGDDLYGYEGGVGLGGGYGYDEPLWGYEDGYYPDLYNYTSFVDHSMPLFDAWGDESWEEEQYALADLMYFQRQLDLDNALSESERLHRWEERLSWEQLSEEERALRYRELAATGSLGLLGLSRGFWGRRFGGRDLDLSYLRNVPLERALARRYSPYFSRSRFRGFGEPINPMPGASYRSTRLSYGNGVGLSLREQELRSRLGVAEMRASLTGLSPAQRAQALDDARRLRAEINAESRLARDIDRTERRTDALLAAREAEAERREMREEMAERRGIQRLEDAAGDLMSRPMPGGFVGGGYGGRYY
ncbi:hypothetical protein Rt10032_c02g1091 [Rhodotorula toruloides]|uniref:Uncharacterized protein n=1 Tax=Rhodotorula toruloides TaxID=5286 RepID=A0A511KCE9_RHOTO|nr:hypothetical protein Rt10032_c02g1091 [Rhodotorula toruloides]